MSKTLSLPVVLVSPINLHQGKNSGIQYTDNEFVLSGEKRSDKINSLFEHIDQYVSETGSILLYKEDVKRLADQLSGRSHPSKVIFQEIKQRIRSKYTVLKLPLDPRTLQFNGIKTVFIIHAIF